MKKSKASKSKTTATREFSSSQFDTSTEAILDLADTNYIHIWVQPGDGESDPTIVLTDAAGNLATNVRVRPGQTITWFSDAGDFLIRFVDMKQPDGTHTHTTPADRFIYAGDKGTELAIKMRNGIPRGAESKYDVYVFSEQYGAVHVDPRLIWP